MYDVTFVRNGTCGVFQHRGGECLVANYYAYLYVCTVHRAGIDAEAARKEEEEMMLRDANQWLNAGSYTERPHPKTGAYALHVAAAKGYINVIKYVLCAGGLYIYTQ